MTPETMSLHDDDDTFTVAVDAGPDTFARLGDALDKAQRDLSRINDQIDSNDHERSVLDGKRESAVVAVREAQDALEKMLERRETGVPVSGFAPLPDLEVAPVDREAETESATNAIRDYLGASAARVSASDDA